MTQRPNPLTLAVLLAIAAPACLAAEPGAGAVAWEWNARVRHEAVDDDAFARNAAATTLRLRLGARIQPAPGVTALLEAEGVAADGRYNSGANGRTAYPTVLDPATVELNQAWLGWKGRHAGARLGRQRLLLDNQRWVGNVGWRQNEQTYDALLLEADSGSGLTARYAWLDRVHRVAGDDALDPLARERALSTQLLNLAWTRGNRQLVGYGYLHDDRDLPSASTATWGLRWTGQAPKTGNGWGWTVEAARQRPHADNPQSFAHDYWLLEPVLARRPVTWRAGWEHLGGDGLHALQTPLATLHAFNGWADKFGTTPPGGLDDRYVGASGKTGRGRLAGKLDWNLAWHDYRADRGGRYGSEWDASLGFPVHRKVSGLVKLADYRSDGFARDTRKLWLQVEWVQ